MVGFSAQIHLNTSVLAEICIVCPIGPQRINSLRPPFNGLVFSGAVPKAQAACSAHRLCSHGFEPQQQGLPILLFADLCLVFQEEPE